jgi:hypothetical protein
MYIIFAKCSTMEFHLPTPLNTPKPPNRACTGRRGFYAIFRHFSGFEFFSAPKPLPAASNADR